MLHAPWGTHRAPVAIRTGAEHGGARCRRGTRTRAPPRWGGLRCLRDRLEAAERLASRTARNEDLARETGRLGAEVAAVAGERDRLRAERDSDRALADRLVDLLQAEREAARARVAELEAVTEVLAGAAAGPNGHGGGLRALWSRIRERRR